MGNCCSKTRRSHGHGHHVHNSGPQPPGDGVNNDGAHPADKTPLLTTTSQTPPPSLAPLLNNWPATKPNHQRNAPVEGGDAQAPSEGKAPVWEDEEWAATTAPEVDDEWAEGSLSMDEELVSSDRDGDPIAASVTGDKARHTDSFSVELSGLSLFPSLNIRLGRAAEESEDVVTDPSQLHIAFHDELSCSLGPRIEGSEEDFFEVRKHSVNPAIASRAARRLEKIRSSESDDVSPKRRQSANRPSISSLRASIVAATITDTATMKPSRGEVGLVETLISYVPRVLVARFARDPRTPAGPESATFPGTVLFIDISGFTSLSEKFNEKGAAGVEEVTKHVNSYFAKIINLVYVHGGDVLKFAGDAMLVQFGNRWCKEDISTVTMRAVQCGLEIQQNCGSYEAEGVKLTLHMGVGSGKILQLHIGGIENHWEFVVAGAPLSQLKTAVDNSGPGMVVCSKEAHEIIKRHCDSTRIKNSTDFHIKSLKKPCRPAQATSIPLRVDVEPPIRCYIGDGIQARLDAGQAWMAELRKVTVLFLNLSGLAFDEREAFDYLRLDESYRIMQTVFLKTEAYVNKVIVDDKGTVVVAAFGVPPFYHEDDAARGVRAALDINQALYKIGMTNSIGVATGHAFCGSVGSATRQEYTVMGDTVNLSARLMKAAKEGVLCDETTFTDAHKFTPTIFEELPEIMVKGKAKAVKVFRPHNQRVAKMNILQVGVNASSLVGRKQEKTSIDTALENTISRGKTSVIVLEGDAGIGKTTLCRYAMNRAKDRGIRCLHGTAHSESRMMPFNAWRNIYRQWFGLDVDIGSQVNPRNMQTSVLNHFEMGGALAKWRRLAPLLNDLGLCSLSETSDTEKMTQEERFGRLTKLLMALFVLSTTKDPFLIVLDNAHNMDSGSWNLANQIVLKVQRLVVLVALRPVMDEKNSPLYRALYRMSFAKRILVPLMSKEDVKTIVCNSLNVDTIPAPVLKLVMARSEGNPLYAVELITKLAADNLLQVDTKRRTSVIVMQERELSKLSLPTTIHGIMVSRLDRLPPSRQILLKVGSVVGREFTTELLEAILPKLTSSTVSPRSSERASIIEDLRDLEDFVELRRLHGNNYVACFTHTPVQEACYNLMPFAQRKALHLAIADWYEKTHHQDLKSHSNAIAFHLCASIDEESSPSLIAKAVWFVEKAATEALQSSASHEGIYFLKKAIELLERLPEGEETQSQHLDLLIKMGPALANTEGIVSIQVENTYTRARRFVKNEDVERVVPIHYGLWNCEMARRGLRAKNLAQEMLSFCSVRAPKFEKYARAAMWTCHFHQGNFVDALKCIQKGASDDTTTRRAKWEDKMMGMDIVLSGQMYAALSYLVMGRVDNAEAMFGASRERMGNNMDQISKIQWHVLAIIYGILKKAAPLVKSVAEELIALASGEGFAPYRNVASMGLGWVLTSEGKREEGLRTYQSALDYWRKVGTLFLTFFYSVLGDMCQAAKAIPEGVHAISEGLSVAQSNNESFMDAELHRVKAALQLAAKDRASDSRGSRDIDQMAASYDRALDLARSKAARLLELRIQLMRAEVFARSGRAAVLRPAMDEILGFFLAQKTGSNVVEVIQGQAFVRSM